MHSCRSCRRNARPLKAGEAGAAVCAMMSVVNRTSARTTSRYRIVDAYKEDRSSILVTIFQQAGNNKLEYREAKRPILKI